MFSFTLQKPITVAKTEFVDVFELLHYLQSRFSKNNDLIDYDWTAVSQKNKRAYMRSKLGMEEGFTLDQAKKLILGTSK